MGGPKTESLGFEKESKETGKEKPAKQTKIRNPAVSRHEVEKVFEELNLINHVKLCLRIS